MASLYDQSRKTTRRYLWSAVQRIVTGGVSQRSAPIEAIEVLLCAKERCHISVGDNTVAAAVGVASIPLEAGEKFHLQITSGQCIAVLQDTVAGALTILPVDSADLR